MAITQAEARKILEQIIGRELHFEYDRCGNTQTCPIEECMLCGVRDCPGYEPLHYHHDGCPYCYTEKNRLSRRNGRLKRAADAGFDTWEDYRGEK